MSTRAVRTVRRKHTDLYGFDWVTAPLTMLNDPAAHAPYDYPKERLNVLQMNAMQLTIPNECVDFVYFILFCCRSGPFRLNTSTV